MPYTQHAHHILFATSSVSRIDLFTIVNGQITNETCWHKSKGLDIAIKLQLVLSLFEVRVTVNMIIFFPSLMLKKNIWCCVSSFGSPDLCIVLSPPGGFSEGSCNVKQGSRIKAWIINGKPAWNQRSLKHPSFLRSLIALLLEN